jgi:hypothetical protein
VSGRPPEVLAVQACLGEAGASSLAQDLAFELGDDCQQASHGATGWRGEIERLGQRDEPDAEPTPSHPLRSEK